jgi:hypothetical protein
MKATQQESVGLPDFRPACPTCRYDLSGLPDGPCPECGIPFRHQALFRAEIARRSVRPPGDGLLVLAIAAAAFPCFWVPDPSVQLAVLVPIWGLTAGWVAQHRRALVGGRAVAALWLIVPLLRTGLALLVTPVWIPGLLIAAAGIAVVVRHAYVREPVRTVGLLTIWAASPLLLLGGALAFHATAGLAAGAGWSPWDYPLFYEIPAARRPSARAIPYSNLLYFGLIILGLGLLPILAGLLALPGARRWELVRGGSARATTLANGTPESRRSTRAGRADREGPDGAGPVSDLAQRPDGGLQPEEQS